MDRSAPGKGGFVVVQGGAGEHNPGGAAGLSRIENLSYLCDMIRQMQRIARQGGCSTLAGILELAFREADLRRRERTGAG
jgi:hypothetical protein